MNTHDTATLWQTTRKIFALALPMAGTQFISIAGGFLSMTMLAKLGHEVLAASALIFSTQITIIVVALSFLLTLSIFIGRAFGAGNFKLIGNYLQQGWTLALIISIPVMFLFWHISSFLLFFGQSGPIVQIVQEFFHANVWSIVPLLLLACNQQLCYGVHKQNLVTISSLLSVGVFLFFAYALIFGKFYLPKLGVAGLGYAMAIQAWFAFIFTMIYFTCAPHYKDFDLFHYRAHKDWSSVKQMFMVGWPISLQMSGEVSSFFVVSAMAGWLGVNELAAFQVLSQYIVLIVVPIFALSQASGILIGQACGAQKMHEVKRLGNICISIGLSMAFAVFILFLTTPRLLASLYMDIKNPANAQTLHFAVILFAIFSIAQLFDAIRNVTTGALRGLYDTRYPMYVGLAAIWLIGIPLSYLFAFIFHWGIAGIAYGSTIGMILGTLAVWYRWRTQ